MSARSSLSPFFFFRLSLPLLLSVTVSLYLTLSLRHSLASLSHSPSVIFLLYQVIGEMREKGVIPDKKHYAMAMFACVTSNQCGLAESIFSM